MLRKPSPCYVPGRPRVNEKATWTPEEDEKLLDLEEKFNGKWDKIPDELKLGKTPFQCELRLGELGQKILHAKRKQLNDPDLILPLEQLRRLQPSRCGSAGTLVATNSSPLEATPEIDTTISLKNSLESVFNLSFDELTNDTVFVKLGECEEKVRELRKEKDQLVEQKDLEIKEAVRLLEKQFVAAYIHAFKVKLQRTNTQQQQVETKEDFSKRPCDALLLTNHLESSFENLDKPPSKRLKVGSIHPTDDAQGNDNEATIKMQITEDVTID